jgi:hypothetical protein
MRRSSFSTGFSFSPAWIADQSLASAPMSMSSSMCRVGFAPPWCAAWGQAGGWVLGQGRTGGPQILEAHVEGRLGVRREAVLVVPDDLFGSLVVVADGVVDLGC